MIVAVIGSRGAGDADYALVCEHMPAGTSEIISGGADGVDTLAARYAREHGLALHEILPDYAHYGRRAPLKRNELIAERADVVLAFWDMRSRGTMHVIDHCVKSGVPIYIIPLKSE